MATASPAIAARRTVTGPLLEGGNHPGQAALLTELLDLGRLSPVGLAEVVERADLAHRVDRKYLVTAATARDLVAALSGSHHVLQVKDRRYTSYRSTYFDTPGLASVRAHIQGRRRRWKIRSRLYVEDALCRLEVKAKTGRGDTAKAAMPIEPFQYGRLDAAGHDFLRQTLSREHPELEISALVPTAELSCVRTTLVDLTAGTRVTIDWRVTGALPHGHVWIDPGHLIVETKGGVRPSDADRVLFSLGARPRSFSKYAATASCLHPGLPDNDVRALRGRILNATITEPEPQPIRTASGQRD